MNDSPSRAKVVAGKIILFGVAGATFAAWAYSEMKQPAAYHYGRMFSGREIGSASRGRGHYR